MGRYRTRQAATLAAGLALAVGVSGASAAHLAKTPTWMTTRGKTVDLVLIAAYNATQSGFNFDGAANGKMTITVPRGARVVVSFSNRATLPHSAGVIAYAKESPNNNLADYAACGRMV